MAWRKTVNTRRAKARPAQNKMMAAPIPYDLAITGTMIFDGLGDPPVRAAVALRGGRVAAIGSEGSFRAGRVLNFPGGYLSPGFIDIHSHSDFSVLIDPRSESKIRQGVTTEVIGNCGSSASPLLGDKLARERNRRPRLRINWKNLNGYRRRVEEKGTAVNLLPLTGQGNLRAGVMGYSAGPPSRSELIKMIALLERELEAGSRGLSTGLIYPPGVFSGVGELSALLRRVAERGGIYATHMRSESSGVLAAVRESIRLAEMAGVSLQISHLKAQGRNNWPLLDPCLEAICAARRRGLDVHCDRYPYTASCTDLDVLLPDWAQEGGVEEELRRLKDPPTLERIKREITWRDWSAVMISRLGRGGRSPCEGRRISALARAEGLDPLDFFVKVLKDNKLKAEAVFFSLSEENLRKVLRRPFCAVGSDSASLAIAGPLSRGFPHPRVFGTFPRFLSSLRRRCGLSWEEAIRRITSLPASKLGLAGRGVIREGAPADLVVFDPRRLKDRADFRRPLRYPEGIELVVVNGEIVFADGRHTGRLPGVVLKSFLSP